MKIPYSEMLYRLYTVLHILADLPLGQIDVSETLSNFPLDLKPSIIRRLSQILNQKFADVALALKPTDVNGSMTVDALANKIWAKIPDANKIPL
jgi:hypothetical protein